MLYQKTREIGIHASESVRVSHQGSEQSYEVARGDRAARWLARSNSDFLKCINPRVRLWQFWEREQNGGSREERNQGKDGCTSFMAPRRGKAVSVSAGLWQGSSERREAGEASSQGIWIIQALRNLMFLVDGIMISIMKYTN